MSTRLKHDTIEGPRGEIVKVSWMPDKRVRFDFIYCGMVAVTSLYPAIETKVVVSYGLKTGKIKKG